MKCIRCGINDLDYSTVCASCSSQFSPQQKRARLQRFHAERISRPGIKDKSFEESARILFELDARELDRQISCDEEPIAVAIAKDTAEPASTMEVVLIPGPTASTAEMKICPFCSEEIRASAIKCKHCHSDLRPASPSANPIAIGQQTYMANQSHALPAILSFALPGLGLGQFLKGDVSKGGNYVFTCWIIAPAFVIGGAMNSSTWWAPWMIGFGVLGFLFNWFESIWDAYNSNRKA